MSQIVDIGPWMARDPAAAPVIVEEERHADLEASTPIPSLLVDHRRRSLPSGRVNDRYVGQRS